MIATLIIALVSITALVFQTVQLRKVTTHQQDIIVKLVNVIVTGSPEPQEGEAMVPIDLDEIEEENDE